MNNNDPLNRYAQSMQQVTVPDQLKQRVFANAEHLQEYNEAPPTAKSAPRVRRLHIPQTIAACLALVLAIGGITAITSVVAPKNNNTEYAPAAAQSNALGSFSLFGETLQAYAATTNIFTPTNENGELLLSRTMEAGLPAGDMYEQYGYYTGCLLAIDAKDASSVSLSISKGQLYQSTIETFVYSDNPQRWIDALTWKYDADQSASNYNGYDFVQPLANLDGKSKDDPSKECRVETAVLLGSNATLDPNTATHSFVGIWTNEPYDGLADDPFSATIMTLDGAYLTVAYSYENGASAQAIYVLKATCVEVSQNGNAIVTTSQEVSPDDTSISSAYTLKAIPISISER